MAFGSVSACSTSSLRRARRRVGGCDDGLQPELRALLEPALGLRRGAKAAREPDLAERRQAVLRRHALRGGSDRQRDGEVRAGLVDADAAGHVDEDVRAAERDACVPAQDGDDHREPLGVDTGRDPPWHREVTRCDERLDLEQDRPRSLERAGDGGADLAAGRTPEELGRIGDPDEAGACHLEHAELVRRAEAVLRRAQHAMRVVAVALELQHAVDEMLEHAWARDRAVLRHVPDEDRRDAELLRRAHQPRRSLAHLRNRAGRRADLGRIQRLHRVDHADVGPLRLERRAARSRARSRRGSRPSRRRRAARREA